MAVSTSENGVKILGNAEGLRLVRTVDNRALDPSRVSGFVAKVNRNLIQTFIRWLYADHDFYLTSIIWQSPVIGAYGASSLSAATNIGVLERGAPVTAIVPLVSTDISVIWRRILIFEELNVLSYIVLFTINQFILFF